MPKMFLSRGCFLAVLVMMLAACTMTFTAPTPVPVPVPVPVATPVPTPVPAPDSTPTESASTETLQQTPAVTPVVIPSYIMQIGVWDASSGKFYGRENTFLVDTDMRLFSTNAHIIEGDLKGKLFRIQIGGVWYPAHTKDAWINWRADTAMFRLEAPENLALPASARLGDTPAEDSDVRVMGYLADPEVSHMPDAPLTPYSAEAFVIALNSEWTINIETLVERTLLMDEFLMSLPEGMETFEIPRKMRVYYYRHFIVILQKEPTYEQRFRSGVSGMPLVGGGGEVVGMAAGFVDTTGIFFGTGGNAALAIPAGEIKKLRDKVIGMLE